jgi:very-short-patch-repair endonuclease
VWTEDLRQQQNIRAYCNDCNSHFTSSIGNMLSGQHGKGSKGCGCINKTEQKVYEQLHQIYPILHRQYRVDWCKNKSFLPFDFVIEDYKIIIELDGPQHFKQIMKWKSPEETRIMDLYKIKCANDNGFSVIRLIQEDVYYDTYGWLGELDITIKRIIEECIVQNVYLCKNNEYEHYNSDNTSLYSIDA